MSVEVPLWVVIILVCIIGYVFLGWSIGPGEAPQGDFDFDLTTPFKHLMNFFLWIVLCLGSLVIYFALR